MVRLVRPCDNAQSASSLARTGESPVRPLSTLPSVTDPVTFRSLLTAGRPQAAPDFTRPAMDRVASSVPWSPHQIGTDQAGWLVGILGQLFGKRKTTTTEQPSPSPGIAAAAAPRLAEPTFAVIDVETTGLSPRADRIVELAVVRIDAHGVVVDEWSGRFDPQGPVGATHIHGITASDVVGAPLFRDRSHDVATMLRGAAVVAHNARFDLAFLRAEFERSGWDLPYVPAFCTLDGSHHYLPQLDRRRLADCCAATGVRLANAHSALGDARATAELMHRYLTMPRVPRHRDLGRLPAEASTISWPSGPTREPVAAPTRPRTVGGSRGTRRSRPRPQQPPLVQQLADLGLTDLLDDGAPAGSMSYLELLVGVLEDGVITESEAGALNDLIEVYGMGRDEVATAHRAFVTALAHRALDDGHVSRSERSELYEIAELLEVAPSTVREVIQHADDARAARLSAGLKPLPDDWPFGEPLRVGDKVAFTGCDDAQRERLERRAEKFGVRVMNNVSRRTAMLVTDGSFSGGKQAKATELGTRIVAPDDFDVLLTHLQPPVRTDPAARAPKPRVAATALAKRAASPPKPAATSSAASPAEIRAWATARGFEVSSRGRLPRAVVEAFEQDQHAHD
ncbi:exonuclease domain-containing protein [Isoptericola haloaureus]|uniref:Histone-like nucleoid-structuring protein Lsr2 n=1 Tax=Isoptericola haloaureus TaxID=1542902 RepID=A0ABU7Z878_9MICO